MHEVGTESTQLHCQPDRIRSSLDCFARLCDIVRIINARLVLLVDDAGDEDGSGLIVRVEVQRAFGMLFGFFEMSLSVGARGFIQLVLGPDLVDERTAGTGADKQSQDRCRADPGPRESHSISSVF